MSLKSDLYDVFTADGMTNDSFAEGIGDAIKSFVSECTLTVTPSTLTGTDTSPSGTFSGSASVSWKITGTKIANSIKAVMDDMNDQEKGDTDLAQAIADGLDDDAPEWTCTISGNTTVPGSPPVTSPSSDNGSITSTFVSSAVKTGLVSCFNTMKDMTGEDDDGNDYFATQLASLIEAYYTGSTNDGAGATHLSGVQFVVVVTA